MVRYIQIWRGKFEKEIRSVSAKPSLRVISSCGLGSRLPKKSEIPTKSKIDDVEQSKRALRVEMLKIRFADIISKATGERCDPKLQRERFQMLQREEVRARREVDRAVREKIERTVGFQDNMEALKELEIFGVTMRGRPLEQLGLYLKDDYIADDDED